MLGGPGRRLDADIRQALGGLGAGHRLAEVGVDALDQRARHAAGAAQAVPHGHVVAGHGLRDRRHLGKLRRALDGGNAERARAARADVGDLLGQVGDHELHLPGDEIGRRRRAALVGHVHDLHAGHRLEELHAQVRGGADAGGAVGELAGIRFRIGDELGDGGRRHRRVDRHHVRRHADQADVGDVLQRVVAEILVERGPDAVRADVAEHEAVAVGRGLRGRGGGNRAAGAGLVLHRDRLPHDFGELDGGDARGLVDAAAGHEADVELRRLRGIRLRERLEGAREQENRGENSHGTSLARKPTLLAEE